ncbi:MAG: substrate-binding domain-containing protein [Thermoanaerobaculia bacterium]
MALMLVAALAPGVAAAQEPTERVLHVYGPGGPLAPMQEAAERFGRERGVRVVVTGGPEAQWIDRAKQDADLIFGGAEYMLSQFAMKHPGLVDGSTREELYVRASGVLVRKGNPKKIRTLEDLTRPGIRLLDVEGAGQLGMWEDMAGSASLIDGIQKNTAAVVANTAEGIEKWKSMLDLDAWIIFESWHYRLKDVTDLVRLPKGQRVYRGTPIAITTKSREKALASDFIRWLKSAEGKEIFVKWGWTDPSDSTGAQTITILHTNDLHGHVMPWRGWQGDLQEKEAGGLARLATAVAAVREHAAAVLLLDAGDTIGDTLEAVETKGSVVIAAMNAIGYDAMVIGNHEPDFTAAELERRQAEARFPLLAANLRRADGSYFTRPYVLRTIGETTVGIVGLAYPNTPLTSSRKNVRGLQFGDAIETARDIVPRMRREGAEVVIALTHLGLTHDQELARKVPGIDVIVGGHSHNRMREAKRLGSTLIVQAGAHGSDLGRLDLELRDGAVVSHRRTLIPITGLRADPAIDALLAERLTSVRTKLEEEIGTARETIIRAQTLSGQEPEKRDAESKADSLFADLVREATGADIALLPGVGYGVAIPAGPIRARDLRNLLPHESKIFIVRLTGDEVRQVMERAIQNVVTKDIREKVGGMIQVSGLELAWSGDRPYGRRVVSLRIGGIEPSAGRSYRVAINSLLAEGGHRQEILAAKERREAGDLFSIVAQEIRRRGSIAPPQAGRIAGVGAERRNQ